MKLLFILVLALFVGCTKEETLEITETDDVINIFYFNAQIEDTLIAKNLSWYDVRSYFNKTNTEIVDELRIGFTWDSRNILNANTLNYSPEYYDLLTGGSLQVNIYDSTLLRTIIGKNVRSNDYQDTLQFDITLGIENTGWESNGSAFDFSINSIKDTTIIYHSNRETENFKIYNISIPQITLRSREDTLLTKDIKDLEMRFPVIIWD